MSLTSKEDAKSAGKLKEKQPQEILIRGMISNYDFLLELDVLHLQSALSPVLDCL